jgi:hypothetical protein
VFLFNDITNRIRRQSILQAAHGLCSSSTKQFPQLSCDNQALFQTSMELNA